MNPSALLVALTTLIMTAAAQPAAGQQAGQAARIWTQVPGIVERIDGTLLQFKADDGRRLFVDLSRMHPKERAELNVGDHTTLIGYAGAQPNQFVAWFLPVESEAAAQASPLTAVDERAWRIVHGTVERFDGPTLVVKSDDGTTLTVDMPTTASADQATLAPGQRVTVIGVYRADRNRIEARIVQPASPAAPPGSATFR